ncbi:phage shock protein B [Croceicoccus naphthovorans]|uniref:Uncharacterized protein n=2 Tax=Croceicoccus naphthovorans TaxID=1348774 RepID=A0A0G3XDY2_9SPHN|nr:envelope stress response membrane protein PspB [Croceicoccus naphthovorans]AKM08851.1 hypothetical protein AB433_00830 [Croceicoccus naphthovorans]MBB3992299.1 phage shock protein B [Croceicoccus naphthovorans]
MELDWVIVMIALFVALPWLVLHYVTKWKTAPKLTDGDEQMLEELYQLARRLDERMDTVERLVAADSPDFEKPRLIADNADDNAALAEIERKLKERTAR